MLDLTGTSGKFDSDYLDEYCMRTYGHTNWKYVSTTDVDGREEGGICIFFFEKENGELIEENRRTSDV